MTFVSPFIFNHRFFFFFELQNRALFLRTRVGDMSRQRHLATTWQSISIDFFF